MTSELIRRLIIKDCPNCGFNTYVLLDNDKIKCDNCGIKYTMHYLPPGASVSEWTVKLWEKDPFILVAMAPDD